MSRYNFKASLAKGKAGEALLCSIYKDLEKLDGRKADFVIKQLGTRIELKTDSYNMQDTANFFIEWTSDAERDKVGGPRQALQHGSAYWAYMYIQNDTIYLFKTEVLVQAIEELKEKLKPVHIKNKTWTTIGYKVPREWLKQFYLEIKRKAA